LKIEDEVHHFTSLNDEPLGYLLKNYLLKDESNDSRNLIFSLFDFEVFKSFALIY
jgi:hypothetical protein